MSPVLPPIAVEILQAAVTSNTPINFVRYDGGLVIAAGSVQFDSGFDLARAALLDHATTMLEQVGWIALQECLGDHLLSHSKKRLVIPSYNLDKDEVYLFKTPHHPRLTRDWKEPMWKIALATSAAPTFFPSCHDVDHIRLIDGGIWANNPTMVGIVEAVSMLGVPLASIATLSIGTTNAVGNKPPSLDRGGLWHWRQTAIDVAMRGQSHGVQGQALHLLTKERAIRLDPVVPDGLFALDKLTAERLLGEAAHASRHFAPMFAEKFMPHTAAQFVPLLPQQIEGE
jgi:hypothetical protein